MHKAALMILAVIGLTALIGGFGIMGDMHIVESCDYVRTEMAWVGKFEAEVDVYNCDGAEWTVPAGTGR